jgi:hypothetical protein
MKQFPRPCLQTVRSVYVFPILLLLLLLVWIRLSSKNKNESSLINSDLIAQKNQEKLQQWNKLEFEHEQFGEEYVESYFVFPRKDPRTKHLLLAFHGCTHSGLDWFRLPEEIQIVKQALKFQFAIIAFSSSDRFSGCWSPDEDLQAISHAYKDFIVKKQHLFAADELSVFAVGASSGGTFVSMLPMMIPGVKGIYIQIGRPMIDIVKLWSKPIPQHIELLYMTKDPGLRRTYEEFAKEVKSFAGKSSQMIEINHFESQPCAITKERLLERLYDVNNELVEEIIEHLKNDYVLDRDTNFPLIPTIDTLGTDFSVGISVDLFESVQEEIQCCFARHELTSEHFDKILKLWIQSTN